LQVAPVSVVIDDRSAIVELSNAGDEPISVQLRAYRWTQDDTGDHQTPADDLIASPPQARIAPGARQIARLVFGGLADATAPAAAPASPQAGASQAGMTQPGTTAPPGATLACDRAYRLTVDEVPPASVARQPNRTAAAGGSFRYVMRYSVPVFVTNRACGALAPALGWRVERHGGEARLIVTNSGGLHARLSQLTLIDAQARRTEITAGLLGYVLANSRMAFALPSTAGTIQAGGQLEVAVNGETVTVPLPAAAAGD
jgi:fimbrial chaperone protein